MNKPQELANFLQGKKNPKVKIKEAFNEFFNKIGDDDELKGEKGDPFLYEDFTAEQLEALKVKGNDGYTPVKGVDYFDGDDGYTPVKGKDYFDGNDGYTPIKGVDYNDGKDGYIPIKGKDYRDGKDGTEIEPKDIVKKLKTLKGADRLPLSAINDNELLMKIGSTVNNQINTLDERWHGGGLSKVTTDATLTGEGTVDSPLSAVAGGGVVKTITAGTGISVDDTDPANPIVTNTAPDQTVSITAGTNIDSVTGTYPNFTINAATQGGAYTLPTASASVLGGVKVGDRLSIDGNGVLSADVQTTDLSGQLHLDQTTPQTIINGRPIFSQGLELGLTPTVGAHVDGKMFWDATWKTGAIELEDDVTLQMGQETMAYVYNGTGSALTQGQVVYTSSTQSGVPSVSLAQGDADATSQVLGVITSTTIDSGTYGYAIIRGHVNNVDTSAWNLNDNLYLDAAVAGAMTNVKPNTGDYDTRIGKVMLKDASTGRVYVNMVREYKTGVVSGGAGVDFFLDDTSIIATSANNTYPVKTLTKVPVTSTEDVDAIACNNNTVLYGEYLFNTGLGDTTIQGGVWSFDIYAGVSSAVNVSSLQQNIYRARPEAGTITIDNVVGTTARATASTGTPFAINKIDPSAVLTDCSYLMIDNNTTGLYPITARTSDTVVTITVPAGYTPAAASTYQVQKKLFGVSTGEINNVATAPLYAGLQLYTVTTVQPAYTIEATDELGTKMFGISNGTRTLYFSHNGTTRYSHFTSPLITRHNDLAGLQGGSAGEYYHLTSAQNTTLTNIQTNYLYKPGISGGQTAIGGTGVTDILKLQGTAGNGTLTSPAIQALVGNNGGTTALTVLNNGNVGIGTIAPISKLGVNTQAISLNAHLLKSITDSTTLDPTSPTFAGSYLHLGGGEYGADAFRVMTFGYHPIADANVNPAAYLGYKETSTTGATKGDLIFGTRDVVTDTLASERMRITSAGLVGIGTTPTNNLDVYKADGDTKLNLGGTGSFDEMASFSNATTNNVWTIGRRNTASSLELTYQTATTVGSVRTGAVATFTAGGLMGLGTTAPTYKLDVKGLTAASAIRSDIGFDIYQVPDPTAPTGVVSAGGSVDTGNHYYLISYTTALGETHSVASAVITTTATDKTVTLTIPVSTDPRVTGRKIYRSKAGEAVFQDYLLATIANNTDVTYVDTAADSTLTGSQGVSYFRLNTTSKNITVNATAAALFDSKGTIVGFGAGRAAATGGRYTIFGKSAGSALTTAADANLFGENAGLALTTGNSNEFFGYNVGSQITTGSGNSAFGHDSMVYAGTTSSDNAMFGYGAGWGVQTNSYTGNSGFGAYTLFSNTTGGYNSAVGYQTLYGNLTGGYNATIGYRAGRYISDGTTARTTGDYGLYLGTGTKASTDGTSNEIVIGYNAIGVGSNKTVIGNSSITDTYFGSSTGASKIWGSALNLSGLTASQLVATDASDNLVSLTVATYPSLTEVSYVKGVTSAIQTQIGTKAPSASPTFTGTVTLADNARIDLTLPTTDTYCTGNTTSSFQSGYTAAASDLVFMGSSSKWLEVDADAVATCKGLLGIALEAKNDTQAMKVALPGSFVRFDAWNWTVGATLYAGETLGAIQETIPTGADAIIKVIGFAVNADTIFFNPSPDQQSVVA